MTRIKTMAAPILLRGTEYLLNTDADRESLWFEGVLYNADELREMLKGVTSERSDDPSLEWTEGKG